MSRTYTLRVPFELPSGHAMENLRLPAERKLGDLTLTLKYVSPFNILEVDGFTSEDAAKAYLNHLRAGFKWVLLNLGVPPRVPAEFGPVLSGEEAAEAAQRLEKAFGLRIPGEYDILINGHYPAVYRSKSRVRAIGGETSPATVRAGIDPALFFSLVTDGASMPRSPEIILDAKFMLALELYQAHLSERPSAQLITLMTALEVLLPQGESRWHGVAHELVNGLERQIDQCKGQFARNSDEHNNLDSLATQIRHGWKTSSIRSRILPFVRDTLKKDGHPGADDLGERARKAYDVRSKLVHTGDLPVNELTGALKDAKEIINLVLIARFRLKEHR